MYYAYILLSSKSHIFYFGSTNNLKQRLVSVALTKDFSDWRRSSPKRKAQDIRPLRQLGNERVYII